MNLEERHLVAQTMRIVIHFHHVIQPPLHLATLPRKLNPYFLPSTRVNCKWIRNPNVKNETTRVLEERWVDLFIPWVGESISGTQSLNANQVQLWVTPPAERTDMGQLLPSPVKV